MPLYKLQPGFLTRVLLDDWRRMKSSSFHWYAMWVTSRRYGYVIGEKTVRGRRIRVYLHRWIMNAPPRTRVYWKNGNHLDNRRTNLVVVPWREDVPHETLPMLRPEASGNADEGRADAAARAGL